MAAAGGGGWRRSGRHLVEADDAELAARWAAEERHAWEAAARAEEEQARAVARAIEEAEEAERRQRADEDAALAAALAMQWRDEERERERERQSREDAAFAASLAAAAGVSLANAVDAELRETADAELARRLQSEADRERVVERLRTELKVRKDAEVAQKLQDSLREHSFAKPFVHVARDDDGDESTSAESSPSGGMAAGFGGGSGWGGDGHGDGHEHALAPSLSADQLVVDLLAMEGSSLDQGFALRREASLAQSAVVNIAGPRRRVRVRHAQDLHHQAAARLFAAKNHGLVQLAQRRRHHHLHQQHQRTVAKGGRKRRVGACAVAGAVAPDHPPLVIDFHYLRAVEADARLSASLRLAQRHGVRNVRVVCGEGNNSANGRAVLGPHFRGRLDAMQAERSLVTNVRRTGYTFDVTLAAP